MSRFSIVGILLLGSIHSFSQNQIEFGINNSISFFRTAGSIRTQEDNGVEFEEGNSIDFARSNISLRYNLDFSNKFLINIGFGGVKNTEYIGAGSSGITLGRVRIHEIYSSLFITFGTGYVWNNSRSSFRFCLEFLPSLITDREISSSYYGSYQKIESHKVGFSHLDTRINFSWIFGNERKSHFVLNTFIRPPSIYVTKMLPDKILAFHVGLGVGWIFDLKKKE